MFCRRDLMRGAVALGALGPFGAAGGTPSGHHLIVVFAYGGWDTTFVLDPKLAVAGIDGPEVDEVPSDPDDRESIETFSGIPVGINDRKRPAVTRFFSAWADRAAVVNGISVGSVAHAAAAIRMLTGTRAETSPDLGTIAGYALGADRPIPHINLGASGFTGELAAYTGRTGKSSQLKALIDRSTPLGDSPTFQPDAAGSDAVDAFLDARAARRPSGPSLRGQQLAAGYAEATARARILASSDEFADSLSLGRPPTLAYSARLPVDLITGGLAQSLAIDSGSSWDTHLKNSDQHAMYDQLFAGLDNLMAELDAAGLAEQTTIAVLSEMGRMPVLNASGGKDHWPTTSALLIGAGVAGGQAFAGTDDLLDPIAADFETGAPDPHGQVVGYDHLAAGILECVGADPGEWLPGIAPFRGFCA